MTKRQGKRTLIGLVVSCVLLLVAIIGFWFTTEQKPMLEEVDDVQEAILRDDAYGVLLLGSDKGATRTNGGDHTDSITYVAINKKKNKAYALPIYRDSLIFNQCSNQSININHVYRDNGATCLSEAVSILLDLPVNYHIYITANGFVDLFNAIGPLELTAEASYCSEFGNNHESYCFTEGQTDKLTGNALLAYTRYRGKHSGEKRAMRHIQVLNKGFARCIEDTVACGAAVLRGMLKEDIETNLPYEELLTLGVFTNLEGLSTLTGVNFEDKTGWHHRIDEDDLTDKTSLIRREIFDEKTS